MRMQIFSCNSRDTKLLHIFLYTSKISFNFPTLQMLGEDLVTVLDFLHVKYVMGLGEGAGANVLARFGLAHPTRLLGLILINATGSAASVLQSFKTKVSATHGDTRHQWGWELIASFFPVFFLILWFKFIQWNNDDIAQSAESFLMYHKFGHVSIS